jgi:hypothetical protein
MVRRIMVVAALLAAIVGFSASPGGAGGGTECDTDPVVAPTEGPAGTAVTVSDGPDGCIASFIGDGEVTALLANTPDPEPGDAIATVSVNGDGSYSIPSTIAAATQPGPINFYVTVWAEPDTNEMLVGDALVSGEISLGYAVAQGGPAVFTVTEAPADSAISVSKIELLPGEEFEVTAKGFEPGSEVELFLESDPVLLARVTADSAGALVATVRVPADFPAGPHTVAAVGTGIGGAALRLEAGVTVGALVGAAAAPATPTPAGTNALPYTG